MVLCCTLTVTDFVVQAVIFLFYYFFCFISWTGTTLAYRLRCCLWILTTPSSIVLFFYRLFFIIIIIIINFMFALLTFSSCRMHQLKTLCVTVQILYNNLNGVGVVVFVFCFFPPYPVTVHCGLGYQLCIEVIYIILSTMWGVCTI